MSRSCLARPRRPARTGLREVLNAIRYLARSGGGWRIAEGLSALTDGLPVVRRFVRRFLFQTIHDVALMLDRERVGREASPTGGVIDNQSVKAPEAKTRGYDAGEKIVGRKRHIAVDTDSRLLMVNLTTADISEGLFDSSSRGECPLFAHRCLPLRRLRRRPPAGRLAIWPCRGHLGACGGQPMAREDARGLISDRNGGSVTFPLTSADYTLHPAHPEVVLGPGAVFERMGLFAFSGILGKGRPPPDAETQSRDA